MGIFIKSQTVSQLKACPLLKHAEYMSTMQCGVCMYIGGQSVCQLWSNSETQGGLFGV